ncbi:MAG: hypothetical protein E7559_06650 [Ruminococcaceae bacterium]|nr:hypothetical protein [Oscillospiraceae bacterium]
MRRIFSDYLFSKNYFVSKGQTESSDTFELLFSLASLFGIRIIKGAEMLDKSHILDASYSLGHYVPEPFYRGFPESVRELSSEQKLYDQTLHYFHTYGMGWFDEAGHSMMERCIDRAKFSEHTEMRDFSVITAKEAQEILVRDAQSMMASSRPLSDYHFNLLCAIFVEYGIESFRCASKNLAVRLLLNFRNPRFAENLMLSDVIKLVDTLNYEEYKSTNVRKLNLTNKDRKFITAVINRLIRDGRCDLTACYEKKAVWCGLLHHIHYKPKNEVGEHFVQCMRGDENHSVYSAFEKAMEAGEICSAARLMLEQKGGGAVLRHLNYMLSRCATNEEIDTVLDCAATNKPLLLLQLLIKYSLPETGKRSFVFTRYNQMITHREKDEEAARRRSVIPESTTEKAAAYLRRRLDRLCRGRLGRVYLDEDMKRIALPLQENTAMAGLGVLPKGSRLPIPEGKVLRAFTYWEKVNDIDLAVIGINRDGTQSEFSWRTMSFRDRADDIAYSGDQTSGYNGGSEYFDIDLQVFTKKNPNVQYLVFTDNVFSGTPFSGCVCKAGYMLRDKINSGQVYEPKTVQSSFTINCDSTFAYLFAIDLDTHDFIWLNAARAGSVTVAGDTEVSFLQRYFHMTSVMSMYDYFALMASKFVDDPSEADVIVSDRITECPEGTEIIRSCDFARVMELME